MMIDPSMPIPGAVSVRLGPDREAIESLEDRLLDEAEQHGYSRSSLFAIRLAFEEAIINAFKHGNHGLPDADVGVEYLVEPAHVCIAIEDRGTGFDPGGVPDPTLDENLDKPSGRGLMLIRSYMTAVGHNERGNRLMMCYQKPGEVNGEA